MENNELNFSAQERLAYAWAVAQSHAYRSSSVNERLLARCREATAQLSSADCWGLLAEVPQLQY